MTELVSIVPAIEISTDTIVEIETALPNLQVNTSESITVEVQPDTYVLSSAGMYTGNMTGKIPTWILDAIQEQLTTGDGNISSVLDDIQLLLDGLQVGVNQAISQIENTNTSMSALETSLNSKIGANNAAILDVYATRVTATEAQTVALQAIGSTFGGNVDAYIGNLASTYTNADSATATNIRTLQASYNEQTARIDTVEYVKSGLFPEWDGISTPTIGEYKEANGVFYTYVGGTLGEFGDGWMLSKSSPYIYADTAVSVLEESTGISIEELRNQIDGVIDSWYYNYVPDQTKEPWSTWIAIDTANGNTNEQIAHSGDLFYDLSTGTSYRFAFSGGVFGWSVVTDTLATLALGNASKAQYTADGKASIYYSETIPVAKIINGTPIPIKIGDLWVQISTGITKVAVINNPTTLGNWGNVSNSAAENALLGLSDLEEARDGVVVVYYLTTTTAATGMTYGDYLVDTDSWNGSIYNVYRYENTSGGSSGTLSWRINTGELSKTLSVGYRAQVTSNTAQNTADSKSQIVYSVTAPTLGTHPLLDTGDQWVNTTTGVVQVWNGTSWIDTTNKGAIDARNGVLHNAALATPPTATGKNDIWVVTDRWYDAAGTVVTVSGPVGQSGKYKHLVKVWDGTTWVQKTLVETQSLGISWVGGASKLLYGPDGGITGWEFADGNGLQSEFKINAQKFNISDGTTGYTPFSINESNIVFNGKVTFSSIDNALKDAGVSYNNSEVVTGINLFPAPYNALDGISAPPLLLSVMSGTATGGITTNAASLLYWTSALLFSVSNSTNVRCFFKPTYVDDNIAIPPNVDVIVSMYVKSTIAGTKATVNLTAINSSYTSPLTGTVTTVANTWHRIYAKVNMADMGNPAKVCVGLTISSNAANIAVDGVMVEMVTGAQNTPSAFSKATLTASDLGPSGTTVIDGGRITTGTLNANLVNVTNINASNISTGSISADRLSSTSGTSTVWSGGGLVSSNFNGNVYGNIGTPTQGFRLSSNATGTSADPNIYGAYIKGATLEGTTMSTGDVRVSADGYPNNYGPIMLLEAYSGTTNISSLFRGRGYSSGYDSKRMCSTTQTFILQASTAGTWNGIYGSIVTTAVTIYVSVNGGAWTTLASNSSVLGQIFCSTVYVADSSSSVQFMSTHSSNPVNGAVFSIQSINGPSA